MLDLSFVVMPRPGVRPWRGGENLFSPEEPAGQKTTGSADQQQSQAVGPLLLYPLAPCKHHCIIRLSLVHQFCLSLVLCLKYCEMPWPPLSSDVIETCLFVLWRHLEYYLLHYTPSDPKDPLLSGNRLSRSRLADGKQFHMCS